MDKAVSDADGVLWPVSGAARPSGSAMKLEEEVAQYFKEYRSLVYGYLASIFGNPGDAEEATQEAFLRLYQYLQSGRAVRNVRSWLLRVAHNAAIEKYRHPSGRETYAGDADALDLVITSRLDPDLNPEERVLLHERWKQLRVAWTSLTLQQRQCLRLRVVGLRYREIAEILGVGISTVEDSLERSIAKLAKGTHE